MNEFESLYFALGLNECTDANMTASAPAAAAPKPAKPAHVLAAEAAVGHAVVVSPAGDDANPGTLASPMRSIQLAADLAAKQPGAHGKTVLLRDGVHYIQDTVYLTPAHSGVAIRGFPGESPTVSGGVKLDVVWKYGSLRHDFGPSSPHRLENGVLL